MDIKLKKIRAFTLGEMLVSLLITMIVVGMAFSILALVQGQMGGIGKVYDKSTELNLLRQSLWIDLNTCDRAFYDGTSGELALVTDLGTTTYRIGDRFTVKGTDTFHLKWKSRKFYFGNREVLSGEIDALDFETTDELGGRPMFIYKNNAATTYMNR